MEICSFFSVIFTCVLEIEVFILLISVSTESCWEWISPNLLDESSSFFFTLLCLFSRLLFSLFNSLSEPWADTGDAVIDVYAIILLTLSVDTSVNFASFFFI